MTSLDAEAELTEALAQGINEEIDREVLEEFKPRWRASSRWIYKKPRSRTWTSSEHFLDAGYFYAPYIPKTLKPVVLNPDDFLPRRGLITRYGKKLLRDGAKYYSKMSVADFVV